jgi:hypothetical protein
MNLPNELSVGAIVFLGQLLGLAQHNVCERCAYDKDDVRMGNRL